MIVIVLSQNAIDLNSEKSILDFIYLLYCVVQGQFFVWSVGQLQKSNVVNNANNYVALQWLINEATVYCWNETPSFGF